MIRDVMTKATLLLSMAAVLASCGEPAATGVTVSIPPVYVNCTTAHCMTNATPNPIMTAVITTSGCTSTFGYSRASSTTSIACTATLGCYGQFTSWVDSNGATQTTIPSGSYSICVRIDYNRDYPASTTGDTTGVKDNVVIGTPTANQFITNWTDL
jgi:hypothetical protein